MSADLLVGPSDCSTVQTIPKLYGNDQINPDVGGAAVAISNIIINILLPILLRWGDDSDIQTALYMLISQCFPIIIATYSSINTSNLSLFDARFGVGITASPVSIYLVYSSICQLFGIPNTLFRKLTASKSGKSVILLAGLLLPIFWLAMNLIISFSPTAFRNSSYCRGMTIGRWIEFQAVSNFIGVLDVLGRRDLFGDLAGRGGLGTLSLVALWVWGIYLVRHRDRIFYAYRTRKKILRCEHHTPVKAGLLLGWYIPLTCWDVVIHTHPFMFFVIIGCLHWSWVLGISKALSFDRNQLSYGQVLSLFSPIPPMIAVISLINRRRDDLICFFYRLPSSLRNGMCFLLTGSPDPDAVYLFDELGRKTWPRGRWWVVVIPGWLVVTVGHAAWILAYVKSGTFPNARNPINSPHRNWKPFSVSLYVNGYLVSCVNILIFVCFFDGRRDRLSRRPPPISNWHRYGRTLRSILQLSIMIPIALVFCAGPLFAPPAALPLAQQYQWTHQCDPFASEIILTGQSDPFKEPSMSFYTSLDASSSRFRQHLYDYTMTNSSETMILTYQSVPNVQMPPFLQPSTYIMNIYTLNNTFESFSCSKPQPTTSSLDNCIPSSTGTYQTTGYLTVSTFNVLANTTTHLRAEYPQYRYVDDAPSFTLRYFNVNADGNWILGNVALQSAVTRRNHPEDLKVCMSDLVVGPEMLAPLGVVLLAQQAYAIFAARPRIYLV